MLLGSREDGSFNSSHGDLSRRRIVNVVLIVYILLILEGALRKWAFPEFSQLLYFVRDPFVALVYAMAIASGNWPRSSPWLAGALALTLLGAIVAVLQLALGFGNPQSPIIFAVYGLRNYFFYIPLAFVIAATFRLEDLVRVASITLVLVTASACLVILQFYSSIDSPINVGSSDNPLLQFRGLGVTGNITRPMGFFTSDVGQKHLMLTSFAIVLAGWFGVFPRRPSLRVTLPLGTVAVLACLAFSGSRGAVLGAALVLAAAFFVLVRGDSGASRGRLVLVLTSVAVLGVALGGLFFADGIAAFVDRWNTADAVESTAFTGGIFGRAMYGFIDFTRLLGSTPLLGYGIGMGGNAGWMFIAKSGGSAAGLGAETDWARHMVDLGPILGMGFLVFRIGLVTAVARQVLLSRNLLATLLFGYVAYELLLGQITGHGSINGYVWMFTGFTLAAAAGVNYGEGRSETNKPTLDRFPNLLR
jgi:hypothetical protein